MEYDVEKLNRMFRKMTARKISVLSRLAGLTDEEISIMKLRWLEGKSDSQICDELGLSQATLVRKRKIGYCKIVDAMDLYGLGEDDELPAQEILDYNGHFYTAQDMLIRWFIRHRADDEQKDLIRRLRVMLE